MNIKTEKPKKDYKFNNPSDTCDVLYSEILKLSKWKFNKKQNREEKEDWYYECKNDFEKNLGLLFGKFIPETLISKEENQNKDKYLKLIIDEFNNFKQKTNLLNFINERYKAFLQKFQEFGFKDKPIKATCNWRLVIGLGASHPQETSMTLHHIYGIPYIPGSAVKGVTRHWAILKFADEKAKIENRDFYEIIKEVSNALENGKDINLEVDGISFKELIEIFGTQQKKGEVIFMDAFPVENINLKIDIMNPHYPNYYGKGESPSDWQNPNPIKFLTVENTKFQFYLLSKNNELLEKAKLLLKESLKEHGIGAKTSLGYGILTEANQ